MNSFNFGYSEARGTLTKRAARKIRGRAQQVRPNAALQPYHAPCALYVPSVLDIHSSISFPYAALVVQRFGFASVLFSSRLNLCTTKVTFFSASVFRITIYLNFSYDHIFTYAVLLYNLSSSYSSPLLCFVSPPALPPPTLLSLSFINLLPPVPHIFNPVLLYLKMGCAQV